MTRHIVLFDNEHRPREDKDMSTPPPDPGRIVMWLLVIILLVVLLVLIFSVLDVRVD